MRKLLLRSLRDALLVSLLSFFIFRVGLIISSQVKVDDLQFIIDYCRTQIHLHQAILCSGCAGLVSLVLWRCGRGRLMVSKPGYPDTRKDYQNTNIPEVNIINSLSSLATTIQSILTKPNKQSEVDLFSLNNKVDALYSEISTLKDSISSLIETLSYTNTHVSPLEHSSEVPDISNIHIDSDSESSDSDQCQYSDKNVPIVAVTEISRTRPQIEQTDEPMHSSNPSISNNNMRTRSGRDKRRRKAMFETKNDAPIDLSRFQNMSEREILAELKQREANRRERYQLPEYLTPEEKQLAMSDLTKLWIEWKRRNPKAVIRDWDYRHLGTLSETHASLPRRNIRQIIANRRTEAMIKEAKEEGKEVTKCEICSRVYLVEKGHRCFITTWGSRMQSAHLPSNKHIIISQDGKHEIKISRRQMVDPDKIAKEYEKYNQYHTMMESGKINTGAESHSHPHVSEMLATESSQPITSTALQVPDSPLIQNDTEAEQTVNTAAVNTTDLYSIVKRAVWDVCETHFRDAPLSQRRK